MWLNLIILKLIIAIWETKEDKNSETIQQIKLINVPHRFSFVNNNLKEVVPSQIYIFEDTPPVLYNENPTANS